MANADQGATAQEPITQDEFLLALARSNVALNDLALAVAAVNSGLQAQGIKIKGGKRMDALTVALQTAAMTAMENHLMIRRANGHDDTAGGRNG